jgi:2,4-dienoyl-CoA reductase-like NADH-dependent reductase (Old Yellow Enzyme family)
LPSSQFRAIIRGVDPAQVGDNDTFEFGEPTAERPTVVLTAGGFELENTESHIKRTGDVVAIGRPFSASLAHLGPTTRRDFARWPSCVCIFPLVANPDLPARIKHSVKLTPYDRNTFYHGGEAGPAHGYTDYEFSSELKAQAWLNVSSTTL